jgi:hypothetical protein
MFERIMVAIGSGLQGVGVWLSLYGQRKREVNYRAKRGERSRVFG